MSSSRKKVVVRRLTGETVPGYLPLAGFLTARPPEPTIDLLDLSGRVISIFLKDIKHICYVRDFNLNDAVNPERLTRRTFLARPRNEGLWLRLTFRPPSSAPPPTATAAPDQLEGLAPIDSSLLDDLVTDAGLQLIPPDTRSNTQRIYVPRTAIADLQLIAVITTPSRKKLLPTSAAPSLQNELFDAPLPPNIRPN
ncbi:MAG: hypothetical protein BGO25_18335 [Acidobacteriales bacterium 59-55]|nr:hypothetical protein [Terriglobales bacterium]OJV41633.1 MAG: hypothetical protein BGO25_18335 [Acidobacteriales bacterium 59-55]